MKQAFLIFVFCVLNFQFICAAELNGVKLADDVTVEGKKLVLNGIGLRKVSKFGIPVKVYVGGLYLEAKSNDSDAILASGGLKRMVLHFVRPVDRSALIDSFRASYEDGCYIECDKKGDQFSKLTPHIVSVQQYNEMAFTFYSDKVEIDTNGPQAKKAMIEDANLAKNLLSVFINKKKPPTEELRKGLLGL